MRELIIANNMIAIARGHKQKKHHPPHHGKGKHPKAKVEANKTPAQKRSAMLKMIMPFLSRETGEKLGLAIGARDANKFASLWDQVKKEIMGKLEAQKHSALAGNPMRDFAFDLSYEDAEKLVCTFKWVLSRLCAPEAEAVDPCPVEPMGEPCSNPAYSDPAEMDKPATVEVVEIPAPLGIDAYPQIAELYAKMLAANVEG